MTSFIGRLAAVSISGSILIGVLLLLLPLLRRRQTVQRVLCRAAMARLLVPFAPVGQRLMRLILSSLPAPEGGFYLTAYRLAEFGAAEVVAFIWFFGVCAVAVPVLWERFAARRKTEKRSAWTWLMTVVCAVHWFNPLVWQLSRRTRQTPSNDGEAQPAFPAGKGRTAC